MLKRRFSKKIISLMVLITMLVGLFVTAVPVSAAETTKLVLLETTDVHGNVVPVNYYTGGNLKGTLSRISTLVAEIRKSNKNVMLFDAGDTIQGSQLAYYWGTVNPAKDNNMDHMMATAMNYLNYDAMVLGNHEFQAGKSSLLDFVDDAKFPVISANTVYANTDKLVFEPYKIIPKLLDNGKTINVGVLGVTTPRWVQWYGGMVNNEYSSTDMYKAVEKYVPEMKKAGADIVVLLSHSGLSDATGKETTAGAEALLAEHDTLRMAENIPDIDVVFYGHTHLNNTQNVKNLKTSNDVLLVQAKQHGKGLGQAVLNLENNAGVWKVLSKTGDVSLVTDSKTTVVAPDEALVALMKPYHEKAVEYMKTVIAKTSVELNSHTSRYADTSLFQLIANAQRWGVEVLYKDVAKDALKNPILSMVAPFLNGVAGPEDYTMIEPGDVTIGGAGSIYLYDDQLQGVEMNGATVKLYLEKAAENFLQVTPGAGEQVMFNPDFWGYYFDMIMGLKYQVDITKPVGERIVNLTYNKLPIDPEQNFTVLMPNFRAGGGGGFPGTGADAKIVFNKTEGIETRDVLIEYLKVKKNITFEPMNNWQVKENFLKHWSESYVYPLWRAGIMPVEEQTGIIGLDKVLTGKDFNFMVKKAFGFTGDKLDEEMITRQAAIVYFADKLTAAKIKINPQAVQMFKDVKDAAIKAKIDLLSSNGVIKGNDRNELELAKEITKAEMATMVARMQKLIK